MVQVEKERSIFGMEENLNEDGNKKIRAASHAGSWYTNDGIDISNFLFFCCFLVLIRILAASLNAELEKYLQKAKCTDSSARGVISP